jgi:hypothetical protein
VTFAFLPRSFGCVKRGQFNGRFPKHGGLGDRIASVDSLGLMTGHLHRGTAGHAGTLQVTNRGTAEVMRGSTDHACSFARVLPRAAKVLDGASPRCAAEAQRTNEDRSYDGVLGPLNLTYSVALLLEDCPQFRRKGKFSPLAVLGFARVEAQPSVREIDMTPPAGEQLALYPPSSDVRERDRFRCSGRCFRTFSNCSRSRKPLRALST